MLVDIWCWNVLLSCQKLCLNFIIIQMIILCLFLSWSKRHWLAHFCATVAKSSFQVNFLILPIDNKSPIFMASLPHLQSGHILVFILFENSLHKWPSFHSGFKKFKRRCKNDFFICLGFDTFKKNIMPFEILKIIAISCTAKRILERLGIQTSSSFVKIW